LKRDIKDTTFYHDAGDDKPGEEKLICVDAAESWSIKMIKRLKAKHPDRVNIKHINKDGSIHAFVPLRWVKISPNGEGAKRVYSEEERQMLRDRMRTMHTKKIKG